VVLSVPAGATAELLESLNAPWTDDAVQALRSISYAPVSVVVSGWQRDAVTHPLDGFGFLAPRKENRRILGTLFSSSMFDHRADEQHAVLTTMIGGVRAPELAASDYATLQTMAEGDLASLIGIHGKPLWTRISRHPQAIPQYTLGHLERMRQIDAVRAHVPGLFFCSNWRGGISIGDCIKNGCQTAEETGAFIESR
jgi:oxygen-dependent protoporphyrinogen oxidase